MSSQFDELGAVALAAPTLEEVAAMQARREKMHADRNWMSRELAEVTEAARKALLEGRDDDTLLEKQFKLEKRIAAIGPAIAELDAAIATKRTEAYRGAAQARLLGIKRGHPSLMTTLSDYREKLSEARAQVATLETRIAEVESNLNRFVAEALVIAERWEFTAPDLPRIGAHPLPASLRTLSWASVGLGRPCVRSVMSSIADSPTGKLLREAGAAHLESSETWTRHVQELTATAHHARAAQETAERERFDAWLRNALGDGPVELDELRRAARDAGVRFEVDRNHYGLSVREAAARLQVVGVRTADDPAVHWAMPGRWDAPYRLLETGRAFSAFGMR